MIDIRRYQMNNEMQAVDFTKNFADWQGASAFNTYWQYSYVNRAAYYANIRGEFYEYMYRWVQNYLWWYDGWVPYFHNNSQGIFSTKIATALVNGAAKKVVGGRLFFKNKNRQTHLEKDINGDYIINEALSFITSDWSIRSNFHREIKKAVKFAAAGGTSLIKLDKRKGDLCVKALRIDSFYPTIGASGELLEVVCFIKDFTNLTNVGKEQRYENYYVVEHRYFGDYIKANGEKLKNVPLVEYKIKKTTGSVTTGADYSGQGEGIKFMSLPSKVRSLTGCTFSGIQFDCPILLPFKDSLGAELVNWTDCVSALPELPFGESLLTNIMPYLQSYDYYWSAFNTDMYLGRGRVLVDKPMQSPNARKGNTDYNSGLDTMMFTKIQSNGASNEPMKPVPIQFDLRSQSWSDIRTMIIQNISINTGINLASIASFLNDTNAAKTAREISTEESETALFVEDKRELMEKPINKILRLVTLFYGYKDEVVLRWSSAGLSNVYARAEIITQCYGAGVLSLKKAIQMLNQDDDEYQLQEEFDNIESDTQKKDGFGGDDFGFGEINEYNEKTAQSPSFDFGRSGDADKGNSKE